MIYGLLSSPHGETFSSIRFHAMTGEICTGEDLAGDEVNGAWHRLLHLRIPRSQGCS